MKSTDFSEGNCKIALDWIVSKYALHTALSLLKLKRKFHNGKLESMEKDPDVCISNLEGLQICMNELGIKGNITDMNFMIHILNHLAKE